MPYPVVYEERVGQVVDLLGPVLAVELNGGGLVLDQRRIPPPATAQTERSVVTFTRRMPGR